MPRTRRDKVFFVLGGFFLTNALLGELTGGKLFEVPVFDLGFFTFGGVVLSIGVIPWPVVFLTTDLINEYFGREGVRKLTYLTVAMIVFSFLVLFAEMLVPAWSQSPVSSEAFAAVFGQSLWIIVGSIVAFLVAQLIDVLVFHALKRRTGHRLLWLRATGSTAVSQLIDTFVVLYIGFVLPGKLTLDEFVRLATGNYLYKLIIAVLITPLIYLGHGIIDRYLKAETEATSAAPDRKARMCANATCGVDLPLTASYCPACGTRVAMA